jgi:hypothetical protein
MNTLPSAPALYSVLSSALTASARTGPPWPVKVSSAAPRRTFQTMTAPSSPAVIAYRPSCVNTIPRLTGAL